MQSFSYEIEGIEGTPTAELMAEDLLADLRDAAESGSEAAIYFGSTEYPEFVYRMYYAPDPNGWLRLFSKLCSANSLGVNPRVREDHDRAMEALSKPHFSRIEYGGFEFTGPRCYQEAPAREPSGD